MITTLYDLDAEAAVVGSLLLDGAAITRIAGILRPEDFYRERHAQLYGAALALHQAGRPIHQVTLAGELERRGILTLKSGAGAPTRARGRDPDRSQQRRIRRDRAPEGPRPPGAGGAGAARARPSARAPRTRNRRRDSAPTRTSSRTSSSCRIKGAEPLVGDSHKEPVTHRRPGPAGRRQGRGRARPRLASTPPFTSSLASSGWGFPLSRPLRVLIVENEGPMRPFQVKLAAKAASWPHKITGALFIKTLDWGAFNFDNEGEVARLRAFIEQERVDLVIGDPLDSLGLHGVGSPDDTRTFVQHLVEVGLDRDVAFWLLGHPRKTAPGGLEDQDELDRASGACGGRPEHHAPPAETRRRPGPRSALPKSAGHRGRARHTSSASIRTRNRSSSPPPSNRRPRSATWSQEVRPRSPIAAGAQAREIAEKTKGGIGARRETIEQLLTGRARAVRPGRRKGHRPTLQHPRGLGPPGSGPDPGTTCSTSWSGRAGKWELEHVVPLYMALLLHVWANGRSIPSSTEAQLYALRGVGCSRRARHREPETGAGSRTLRAAMKTASLHTLGELDLR